MSKKWLKANPKRQATDSIRGYVYQIYQSLLSWITLTQGEILVLEGAEDFDVYENESVRTTQVKDTRGSGAVTLRSADIIEAINNFWKVRQDNPDFNIQFRFLTTSSRGQEQGSPFGKGVKGLDYWDQARRTSASLNPIVTLLLSRSISEDLKAFLQEADGEEIRNFLIRPIGWDTGRKPTEAVEQAINDRLITHGLTIRVPAHDSENARGTLLEHVAKLITNPGERVLRFGDFARLFETCTGHWQSRAQINALQNETLSRSAIIGAAELSPLVDLILPPPVLKEPPPLVQGAITRDATVEELEECLEEHKVLFIYGSTGLGKTTLARLLVSKSDRNWLWGSFRGIQPAQISEYLNRAANRINLLDLERNFVLDDLDLSKLSGFETNLIGLVFGAVASNGRVIITSQSKAPRDLFPKLWLEPHSECEAPYFTEAEIQALAESHGCDSSKQPEAWARLISTTTQGHPQLVHARVRSLNSRNWSQPAVADFIAPADIQEIKKQAARRLMEEIPSEASRTFAYRVSIIGSDFSRRMAMALAQVEPPIALPGEAFEVLVGPWVEQRSGDSYRISPLLAGVGQSTFGHEHLAALHEAVAFSYVQTETVSPFEASTALMHALAAKSEPALVVISKGLMTSQFDMWPVLADYLFWFVNMALAPGQSIFENNPAVNTTLRGVQFLVAANLTDKTTAITVAERWLSEIDQLEPEDFRNGIRLLAYSNIFMHYQVPFRPRFIISLLPEFDRLSKGHAELKVDVSDSEQRIPAIEDKLGRLDPVKGFVAFEVARIDGIDAFEELLDAFEGLSDEERNRYLEPFNDKDFSLSDQLVGRAWLPEVNKEQPDIERCIAAFERGIALGQKWEVITFVSAGCIAISVLRDEYLDDKDGALTALDEVESLLGKDEPNLLNQRAKVLSNKGENVQALGIWEKIFKGRWDKSGVDRAFAARFAGITAAVQEDWEKAEEFFRLGAELIKKTSGLGTMRVGFLGDFAFALWKQGKRQQALQGFANVLNELRELSNLSDLRIRALHAVVGHTIAWMYFDARDAHVEDHVEPAPGVMSSQARDEGFQEIEVRGLPITWHLLGGLESFLGLSIGIKARADEHTGDKTPILFQLSGHFDQIVRDFREADFENLGSHYVGMMRASLTSRQLDETGEDSLVPGDLLLLPTHFWDSQGNRNGFLYFVLAAVVALSARKPTQSIPFRKWKKEAREHGINYPELEKLFKFLEDKKEDPDKTNSLEMASFGIIQLSKETLAPSDLFRHHFYLLNLLSSVEWGRFVGDDLDSLVTNGWRFVANNQKFALRLPGINAPALIDACDDSSASGYQRVAKVLLLASDAAEVALAKEAQTMLEELASKTAPEVPR